MNQYPKYGRGSFLGSAMGMAIACQVNRPPAENVGTPTGRHRGREHRMKPQSNSNTTIA